MLSVIRELAEEAERRAGGAEPLGELLVELVRHGDDAVARTPEQLEVLREAGVVDAGGAGLVELLRGHRGRGDAARRCPRAPAEEAPSGVEAIHLEPSRYRYCTVFVVEGDDARSRRRSRRSSSSSATRSSSSATRPRSRCTSTPTTRAPRSRSARAAGTIDGVEIANMHEQQEQRERASLARPDRGAA